MCGYNMHLKENKHKSIQHRPHTQFRSYYIGGELTIGWLLTILGYEQKSTTIQ